MSGDEAPWARRWLHLDLREHVTVFHATAHPVWDPGVAWGVWAQLVVRIASHVHPSYRSAHTRSGTVWKPEFAQ